MTEDEHHAVALLAELFHVLSRIVGNGHPRDDDLRELGTHVHALQAAVLSQCAARTYPERYRLLGESL